MAHGDDASDTLSATLNERAARDNRRTTASILGASLDVGNRGVRALAVSLADLLTRRSSLDVAFHYGNAVGGRRRIPGALRDLEVQVRNCRMSPRSMPAEHIIVILCCALLYRLGVRAPAMRNPWLRSLLTADFIGDIRGGDSFSDIYGLRRFVLGSLPLVSVAFLGRPYVMLPQTYGPFRRSPSRQLARFLLRRAATILTRDRNCESIVVELTGRSPRFCPDVAFTLAPLAPTRLRFAPGDPGLGSDVVIGVNVSGLLYMGGYTGRNMFGLRSEYRALIDELVDRLLCTTEAKILLVPHVFGSEAEEAACSAILDAVGRRYPGRLFMLAEPLTEREIKWVIGQTQFFVGSRMHACIAALSQCVPAVGLAYSDKFLGVFESAGVGSAILDLRKMDGSTVVAETLAAVGRRDEVAERLKIQIPAIQEQVFSTFRELLADVPLSEEIR
jgi:polysaccharide pyruvyl transferase WcaK-like protein